MTLMRESWILIAICMADLLTTLGLLADKNVFEGNPLMKFYLDLGVGMFIAVKLILVVMPLFLAEYSKQFSPVFVRSMLRLAIVVYIGAYTLLFAGVNLRPLAAEIINPDRQVSAVATAPNR
ncbi:MAG: DUF5658 family protein [Armatimonadota bacterium]|nr:DUF5658 family protein [Armatimonadota bacterium]